MVLNISSKHYNLLQTRFKLIPIKMFNVGIFWKQVLHDYFTFTFDKIVYFFKDFFILYCLIVFIIITKLLDKKVVIQTTKSTTTPHHPSTVTHMNPHTLPPRFSIIFTSSFQCFGVYTQPILIEICNTMVNEMLCFNILNTSVT